ncbi:ABC transporter ATP-binding protein [Candidatus Parcubacteria bacterium]|nr:MAG: ABC transporter ATP-binding protein [Candidatus Parcubacteria bacterium]
MRFKQEAQLIWKYLKPQKKMVYFLSLVVIVNALINAFIPYLYGKLVDQAIAGTGIMVLGVGLLSWLVLSLVAAFLSLVEIKNSDILSVKVNRNFLEEFIEHFLNLPLSFHRNQKIFKIIGRAERAGSGLERIVEDVVFSTLPGFLTVIVALLILTFISPYLSLFLFFVLLVYGMVTIWKTGPIIEESRKLHWLYDEAYSDYYEILENVSVVKSFTAEEQSQNKLKARFSNVIYGRLSNVLAWTNLSGWQQTIFSFGFVSLFGFGLYLLKQEVISAGSLVTFVGYIALVYRPFGELANNYRNIRRNMAILEKSIKLFDIKTENQERGKILIKLSEVRGEVEFRNVNFSYPGKNQPQVLFDINFKIEPGTVVALVGESGVGKSTLVDLISGYYLPGQGQVLIDGFDTREIDVHSLRKHLAVVPQEVFLFHETLYYNLNFGSGTFSHQEIENAAKAAYADSFISFFPENYNSKVGERGVKLSVGQKQRIAIARAILRSPKILILDEATSSLDSITEHLVQSALKQLIFGRTTFIIAHRLSTITHADIIFVLSAGRILEKGRHEELLEIPDGIYKKLFEAQKF